MALETSFRSEFHYSAVPCVEICILLFVLHWYRVLNSFPSDGFCQALDDCLGMILGYVFVYGSS